MKTGSDRSRLQWRCRRGMLELDLLLQGFLENRFEQLDAAEQESFVKLLELPDQELFEYLMERKQPRDGGIASVIEKICHATQT